MKKIGSILILLSASWLISACDTSDENPKDTVASAAQALKSDDKKAFRSLLAGIASAQFQSNSAIEQLQSEIENFRKLSISSEKLIREENISSQKTIRYYSLEIKGDKKHFMDVQVKCQLNYGESADAFDGRRLVFRDGHGRPPAELKDPSEGNHTNPHGPAEPSWPDHTYDPPHNNPHGPAESNDPDDRPSRPPRPHRPERPEYPHNPEYPNYTDRPDYNEHPSQPAMSWHQVCRIIDFKK